MKVPNNRKSKKGDHGSALSRRSFLKGAGAAAAVAGVIGALPSADGEAAVEAGVAERLGPGPASLELKINGKGVVNDAVRRPFILYRILMGLLPF